MLLKRIMYHWQGRPICVNKWGTLLVHFDIHVVQFMCDQLKQSIYCFDAMILFAIHVWSNTAKYTGYMELLMLSYVLRTSWTPVLTNRQIWESVFTYI